MHSADPLRQIKMRQADKSSAAMPCATPCPFCSGTDIDPEFELCEFEGHDGFKAGCWTCEATGPAAANAQEALAKWNRRVAS